MQTRKFRIQKPTHKLVANGAEYAVIRCGHGSPAARLASTGETNRSVSFILDCDFLMGRWQDGMAYLFGADADAIPRDAVMVRC